MKKTILLLVLIVPLFFLLPGCGKEEVMNEPADDGKYHYKNEELGFGLNLPEEFIYFQTQRKTADNYAEIEIFLPTSDEARQIEVPGYWKPVMVRIYDKDAYGELSDGSDEKKIYSKVGESKDKIYLLNLWQDTPEDWLNRWTPDLENEIKEGFYLID